MPEKKGLPPPPDQQSRFVDALSGLGSFISSLNPFESSVGFPQGRYPSAMHPDYASFNERLTRAPGIVVPPGNLPPGVDAQYLRGKGFPGETDDRGVILIKPDSASNTISHEAAHALYNQAGLYRDAPKFENQMNPSVKSMISESPHYQRAIEQDPSTLTDEGLGYAMNAPTPADESYVNAVASRIEDPVVRQRLLMLFQHAKAMSDASRRK